MSLCHRMPCTYIRSRVKLRVTRVTSNLTVNSVIVQLFIQARIKAIIKSLHKQTSGLAAQRAINETTALISGRHPGGRLNIKTLSYWYGKSHCGDKTIWRPSDLHNGIPHTSTQTTSLYWDKAQMIRWSSLNMGIPRIMRYLQGIRLIFKIT